MRMVQAFFIGGPKDGTWDSVERHKTRFTVNPDGPTYYSTDLQFADNVGTVRRNARLFHLRGADANKELLKLFDAYSASVEAQAPAG